ncbi:zinc finger protein 862-like [Haliotis asinina]|uniref:zinc finger protein 862-like n=1 Tax=Haliotis asinina TaxID=109174 RepID=UPI003531E933
MHCDFCRQAGHHLAGNTDFVDRTNKFKRENIHAHSISVRHGKCRDHIVNKSGKLSFETSTIAKQFLEAEVKSNEKDLTDLTIKFNTVYCIGKEEMSFTKLKPLLLLQRKNGLPVTLAYSNDVRCGEMLATIASTIRDETMDLINDSHYLSVMIDGATDSSVSENEVIYVRTVLNGKAENKLVEVIAIEHGHAEGVISATKSALSRVGISDETLTSRIVGFCADGANVNMGQRNGVVSLLRHDVPHLIDFHCMAHRLELALLKLQKQSPIMQSVNDCLHLIWKTYHFSPKSKRELKMIGEELEARIYSPAPVKGTRWVPQLDRAMRVFLQGKKDEDLATGHGQYTAVYTHMESLAASSSNADIAGRGKKIHKQMKDLVFTGFCHFMSDLFGEVALLSLKLQSSTLILPTAVASIQDCLETITSMKQDYIPGGLYEKFGLCIESQENLTGPIKFQGIEMTGSVGVAKEELNKHVASTVDITIKELESRFENLLGSNTNEGAQGAVKSFKVFNHDTWPESKRELVHFGNHEIDVLCDWFRVPLVSAGCNVEALQTEWRQMKVFVANTFKDKSYSDLWQILLSKDPYKTDFCNILHIVRIMLTLPISSAECERAFSAQKRIKSDVRSCLSVQRLSDLILISSEGPDLAEFNPEKSVNKWMSNGKRRIAGGPGQTDWSKNIVTVKPKCEDKI